MLANTRSIQLCGGEVEFKGADLGGREYIVATVVVLLALRAFWKAEAGLVTVAAAIAAMGVAAFHMDKSRQPGIKDNAIMGATLAVLSLLTGAISQYLWGWMKYPDVDLTIDAIGSFVGALVIFPSMTKAARPPIPPNQ